MVSERKKRSREKFSNFGGKCFTEASNPGV